MNKTITIPFGEYALPALFYGHTAPERRGCIFYFHGGGLVFGTGDDLPSLYIGMLNRSGYDLVSLSYPLAPESPLPLILQAACHQAAGLLQNPQLLGYDTMPPCFLLGRSAGAYLALMSASHIKKQGIVPAPKGVLSFYGYHTLDIPEFRRPSPAYQKLPAVPERIISRICPGEFLTEGPKELRFSLYIYARQTGTWPALLGCPDDPGVYGLSEEDLALLPPSFFTASSGDLDVPFRISKYLASKVPGSVFKPVYYLEHDFDRDTRRKEGMQIYEAAIAWMDEKLR